MLIVYIIALAVVSVALVLTRWPSLISTAPHKLWSSELKGKKCVVTGGGNGLGKEIVQKLISIGADVAAVDRDIGALKTLQDEVDGAGNLHIIAMDLLEPNSTQTVVDDCIRALHGIDLWINNAGVCVFGRIDEDNYTTEKNVRIQTHLNLVAPMLITRNLLLALQKAEKTSSLGIAFTG